MRMAGFLYFATMCMIILSIEWFLSDGFWHLFNCHVISSLCVCVHSCERHDKFIISVALNFQGSHLISHTSVLCFIRRVQNRLLFINVKQRTDHGFHINTIGMYLLLLFDYVFVNFFLYYYSNDKRRTNDRWKCLFRCGSHENEHHKRERTGGMKRVM